MVRPLRWLWRVLGRRYPRLAIMALLPVTFIVTLGGLGLLTLYQEMSAAEFWTLVGFAEALTAVGGRAEGQARSGRRPCSGRDGA